ncbi:MULTISPECIES: ABC transporter ATP-binding protein [Chroococcidiopsis]|jgi:ATP-binding cassette, subfamily B, multidrug efflux pump|uniref:ABC transporter related protein n=1 Tax=Chroococcidiopsis thermalis (strain PCC 7203) TaxID=251229 RepID=K9TUF2_CHRTP|nr:MULTISPECIES: ABC transporter ATP-binding protein [Chroococcidiopsis]AFY85634.1 ABC transporter related protein [Chroococcidiopsis thermalis PCC 7203]PSB47848.1 ABC transporter ATP-binding protein [Cyanosarcina cf. burmensis CCALA 770]URD50476.1 ABC transporter ATP-binding protein/permease [Chroococcidiopsis sp. CCNUC1]
MTTSAPVSQPVRNRRRQNDWRLFLRLIPYGRRHGRLLLISTVLLVPVAIANAVQPILIGQAISLIRKEPNTYDFLKNLPLGQGLQILEGLLLLTVIVRLIFSGVQGYLVQKVGQQMTADIRNDLFAHVTSLAVRFFDRTPVGKLITRLTSDVEALGDVFTTGAIGIISDLFSMLVILALMFQQQWQLALMLLLMLFPVTGLIIFFQQQYRKANYKAREELSLLNSTLQENISGINVVQMFRREQFNAELFRATNLNYIREVDRTIFHDSAVSATLEWVALVAVAGVLWLGGIFVLQERLEFGVLAAFILFAQRLFDPLRQFAEKFTAIQAGFTAVERISDILDEPIEIRDPVENSEFGIRNSEFKIHQQPTTNNQQPTTHVGEIRFEHVWFAYKNDDYVIKDLDFTIRPGEKIALVGPTGAGKSSIIRLLCRLYEPTRGRILVDGVDIRDIPQAELRCRMGVILQEGFIFAGDVKSNITLGDTYSFEEIRAAAENTNVAQFIEQLPQGYDTQLRERGTNLSSGQKQLLAFARAAIRNPHILVLDEATASLDVGTEASIQDALERLLEGRTAIIIAHRLSTIRNVDRIFVLKRGELVESGTHEELIQLGGLYAGLHQLQMLGT